MKIYTKDSKKYAEVKEGIFVDCATNKVVVLDKKTLELSSDTTNYNSEKATRKSWTSIHNSRHLYGTEVPMRWYDYNNFVEDMGHRPEGLCLVRKDKDQGFHKENCEWAPRHKYSSGRSYRT